MTQTRAARIAEQIESMIVSGRFPPGTRLGTKDDLRRRYEAAYGTVNEALRILQLRGYLRARTGRGGGVFTASPPMRKIALDEVEAVRRALHAGLAIVPVDGENRALAAVSRLLDGFTRSARSSRSAPHRRTTSRSAAP